MTVESAIENPEEDMESGSSENGPLKVTLYTADSSLRQPGALVREILTNIQSGRELAWRMFVRNIRSLYRQTALGLFWAFLPPLANTAIWVFLSSTGVVSFADGITVAYIAYVLTGMVLWQSFVEAINMPLRIVKSNSSMLSKLRFPRESILLVGIYELIFNLVIRSVVLIPIVAFFALAPVLGLESELGQVIWSWKTLLVPLGAFLLLLLGTAIGLVILPVGMLYHDVGRALIIVTPLWMLFTQIIYPPRGTPEEWAASPLNWLNPASPLLLATRDLMVLGDTHHWLSSGVYALLAIPLFCVGVIVYRVSIPILVERI
jgi:lipopolysaccharide transport system permease protein